MKKFVLFFFAISLIFLSCNSKNGDNPITEQKNYQITKEELLQKELKNPKNFLRVTGDHKRNILGQTVIKGSITNNAAVATYKDVKIKLTFYSKTNALLDTEEETIFEQFFPGDTKRFKTKYFAPKGTDSVALAVINAKADAPNP
ncbi:MAG: hypothetical protein ABI208_04905 [Ginsengibacter sp.]|jgi:hypothetical protein